MKRLILFVSFFTWGLFATVSAQPENSASSSEPMGELSLPWPAFQNLIKMGQDDITLKWEEFQKLLQQTGARDIPPYQLKDGNVVLSRSEFKKLLDQMQPAPSEVPKPYLTKAVYTGTIREGSTLVEATFRLELLSKDNEFPPVKVPLFPSGMAFREISLNGQPALIENSGGQMTILVTRPGPHIIKAVFSVATSLKKEPNSLSFSIPETPITELNLFLPLQRIDVQVANASFVETFSEQAGTRVRATLPTGRSIHLNWHSIAPEVAKGPAKVYADVYHVLSIEDDAVRVKSSVMLDVLQNTINSLTLSVPPSFGVVDVQGEAVGEWEVRGEKRDTLFIPFQYARRGAFSVRLTLEQILKESNNVVSFSDVHVMKAVRERGFLGVEQKSNVEVTIPQSTGLDRVDVQDLPGPLLNMADRPVIFGFKYLRPPYGLDIEIKKHKEVAVLSTVIDEAKGVTLVLEDGKRIHQITYTVRNSWKQFLELALPDKSQVWSVFVEGEMVRPSKNQEGRLLIPLNRSRTSDGTLRGFDVEVMFFEEGASLGWLGRQAVSFPIPDVMISQLVWSLYLPVDYGYLHFGGNLDKEDQASGVKPLLSVVGGGRNVIHDIETLSRSGWGTRLKKHPGRSDLDTSQQIAQVRKSELYNRRGQFEGRAQVGDDLMARQVFQELNFLGQVQQAPQGALLPDSTGAAAPMRVRVPNSGRVFRFAKQIIVDETPIDLSVTYVSRGGIKIAGLFIIFGTLWGLFVYRAKIQQGFKMALAFRDRHTVFFDRLLSPGGLVLAASGVLIVFILLSRLLGALAFVFFLYSLIRWGVYKLKDKRTHQGNPQ